VSGSPRVLEAIGYEVIVGDTQLRADVRAAQPTYQDDRRMRGLGTACRVGRTVRRTAIRILVLACATVGRPVTPSSDADAWDPARSDLLPDAKDCVSDLEGRVLRRFASGNWMVPTTCAWK